MYKNARIENARLAILDADFALSRLATTYRAAGYAMADFAEACVSFKKDWRLNIMKRRAMRKCQPRRLP